MEDGQGWRGGHGGAEVGGEELRGTLGPETLDGEARRRGRKYQVEDVEKVRSGTSACSLFLV